METLDDLFPPSSISSTTSVPRCPTSATSTCCSKRSSSLPSRITRADGGTLYLLSDDRRHLHFEIVRTDSLGIAFGGTSGSRFPASFPTCRSIEKTARPTTAWSPPTPPSPAGRSTSPTPTWREGFDFSGTRQFDARTGYRSQSFLTVPMKNHEGEVIGVLQLINAIACRYRRQVVRILAGRPAPGRIARLAGRRRLSNRQLVRSSKRCSNPSSS
jgi:hypothetical protein